MLGMSIYVILEIVDMLFVGFLGTTALASVGISIFLAFLVMALFGGVSIAVQATTARLVGEGETQDLGRFLRTALLLIGVMVPFVTGVLMLLAPTLLDLMTEDAEVAETGRFYLVWLLGASTMFTINSAFMGYWNAVERTTIYMKVVVLTAIVNIPANYVFMFGFGPVPAYGVTGAGIGTCLASIVGAVFHIAVGYRKIDGLFTLRSSGNLPVLVRLMIPAGLQQFTEALALTLMFRIVAFVGTVEVAVYSVLVNLVSAVGLPAWGLGLAGATLVGQALGAKDPDDAHRWAWDVVKLGVVLMMLMGTPLWLFPEFILSFFIREPETLEVAILPAQILGLMIGINGMGYLFANMLNGAGDVKRVMYVNLATQYFVLLPGAWFLGIEVGFGLIGIWLAHQVGFRALNSVILARLWQQRKWAKIQLW